MTGIGGIPYVKTWKFIREAATAYGAHRLCGGTSGDRAIFHEITEKGWDAAQYQRRIPWRGIKFSFRVLELNEFF